MEIRSILVTEDSEKGDQERDQERSRERSRERGGGKNGSKWPFQLRMSLILHFLKDFGLGPSLHTESSLSCPLHSFFVFSLLFQKRDEIKSQTCG